jgi:flagellar secretion chaperone FliS
MGMSQELTYRQMAVETASPVELVIMLSDLLVKDLKQVAATIREHDIEERVKHSNRAFLALQELDLMLDFEHGGDTAKELARVYSYVRAKLIESQIKLNPAIVERQIEFIQQIRQAWQESVNSAKIAESSVAGEFPVPAVAEGASSRYASLATDAQSCSWSA